jgi:hypothetical protein
MGAITSTCTYTRIIPGKWLKIETPATAVTDDTIVLTLADYGMATLEAIVGFNHSTTDSIIITEAPTTAVASGVLTITVGGTASTKKRVYWVFGESP